MEVRRKAIVKFKKGVHPRTRQGSVPMLFKYDRKYKNKYKKPKESDKPLPATEWEPILLHAAESPPTKLADQTLAGRTSRGTSTAFFKGHRRSITCLDVADTSKRVFTGAKDCCVVEWDLAAGEKNTFSGERGNAACKGHFADVLALAASHEGNYLVSGGADKALRVWDTRMGKQVWSFDQHTDCVTVSVSGNSRE